MVENKELKETLDNYILRGLSETKKNYTIKTRLGLALKEDKMMNLPRVYMVGGNLMSFDVKFKKHGKTNHFKVVTDEYTDGTLLKEDGEVVNYGWLALTNEKSIYPVKMRLIDSKGVIYEAISLTDARFSLIIKNKHLSYGLYLVNGLGVFCLSLTQRNHLMFKYVEGIVTNKFMDPDDYRVLVIPSNSLAISSLLKYSGFNVITDEGELPYQK